MLIQTLKMLKIDVFLEKKLFFDFDNIKIVLKTNDQNVLNSTLQTKYERNDFLELKIFLIEMKEYFLNDANCHFHFYLISLLRTKLKIYI